MSHQLLRRRAFLCLALGLAGAGLCGCTGDQPNTAVAVANVIPARYARLERMLRTARAAVATGNLEAVQALRQPISTEGVALLRARIPSDLRRQDMPRFLSARQLFGATLKRWVSALERGDEAAIVTALGELDDATHGWIDAYLGRATEAAV